MRPLLHALCLSALIPVPAAAGFTPPADIDAAVAAFLGAGAGTPGGAARPADPRLKLALCENDLEIAWFGSARGALQVSCPARGWRVFIPVRRGEGAGAVVQRGETVSLVYEGPGFVLTRQGEALEPGAAGQWIRIKPGGESAKPLRAEVIRPGTVRVSGK